MRPLHITLEKHPHLKALCTLWLILWPVNKSAKARFLGVFGVILFSTALMITVPLLLKEVVEHLNNAQERDVFFVFTIVGIYGLAWTLSRLSITFRQFLMFRVMEKGVMELSAHIFKHLHSLSYAFHVKRKTGEITSAIEKAQVAFPGIVWPLFFLIIPTFLEVLIVSLILASLYGISYGIIMIGTVVFFLVFSVKALNWSLKSIRRSNEKHYAANAAIVDSFINFSTVKLFNTQEYEFSKCKKFLVERQESKIKALAHGRYVLLGQDMIIGITLTAFSLMCVYMVISGGYDVSDFVLINLYVLQFSVPLGSLGFILGDFHEQLTHMEKVIDLLDENPIIEDGTQELEVKDKGIALSCKGVSFEYEPKRSIIKNISFELLPGQTIAFVGPTGSGKSTISNLLMRFYLPKSGSINVNGQNIHTLKQESFLKHVGVVPQDIALFNDTLRSNLLYGNPSATEERLEEIIKLTLLDHLIDALPEGVDTIVGERGLALSAGEKQKVGIARVLLKEPSFYIFDEATSSLDVETEEKIMKVIRNQTYNASVLVIAHRLSTVKTADTIHVFNKGEIIESGSHDFLIKKKGFYAHLYETQSEELERPKVALKV